MDKKIIRYLVEREDTFKRWIGKEKLGMKIHASLLILASLYFKIFVNTERYLYFLSDVDRCSQYTLDSILHCDMPVILLLLAFLAIILARWGKMLLVCNLFFTILNLFLLSLIIGEISEFNEVGFCGIRGIF